MTDCTVLVTDALTRNALAVIRSLGNHDVTVVAGESTRFATGFFSKHVSERVVYPNPDDDPEGFYDFLQGYVREKDLDAVVPTAQATTNICSQHRSELLDMTGVPVPGYETFTQAWNKGKTMHLAEKAGVPYPETAFPKSTNEATELAREVGFPLVIKPRVTSGSRGLRYVQSPAEFEQAYRQVSKEYDNPLIQERIPQSGRGLGTAFLYDDDHELKLEFAYRRLREYPPSGGPSTLRESVDGEKQRNFGRRLLEEAEWRGVAMVEFKRDPRDGTPKLMEINPRFWGSLHLPLYAGIDFPWWTLQYALGNEFDSVLDYERGVQCRYLLPGDLLYLLSKRDRAALDEFLPLRRDNQHYDIFSWEDVGPSIGRMATFARYGLSPTMWKHVVFRNL